MECGSRVITRVLVLCLLAAPALSATDSPALANGGFEEVDAEGAPVGWFFPQGVPQGGDLVQTEAGEAHGGERAGVFRSGGEETMLRQEVPEPGHRPLIVSAHIKADDLVVKNGSKQGETYARFYVHVLYKDQPYSETSHFYVNLPSGTYDWRPFAVEVLPRGDLEPEKLWVSVAARFDEGTLYADDVSIEFAPTYRGCPAECWELAGESVVISDLSVCTPEDALSEVRKRKRWKVLEYETAAFAGKCVAAGPNTRAKPLALEPKVSGWHAIYLGMAGHLGKGTVRVKVAGDEAYQFRGYKAGHIQEVFFKCADLSDRKLHFAQQSDGHGEPAVLMYVKLVPLTVEEVALVQQDAGQRETKRLVGTIDGFSFIYERCPTTRDELLEEFEGYRGSDFGTIWWCISGADQVNYESDLGTINGEHIDDFPRDGDEYYTDAVTTLIDKGIDMTEVAVEAVHSLGAKIHISMRPAAWQASPPYEDFFASDFYRDHPEWRCVDRDGTPVFRMSFAVPEVRRHLLGVFKETLKAKPDGLNVLYNRGMPLILWEKPFCDLFRERYNEDARQVPEDDPRLYALRGEILTTFMREICDLLDEAGEEQGLERRLELSAMVLETEGDNRKFGLDVEGWVRDGLVDALGVYGRSSHSSGKQIDMDYFMRITEGSDVPVYPCLVAWQLPKSDEMLSQAVAWYDAGAAGVAFWDPSGLCRNGALWPMVSRMGHVDETRRWAAMGAPSPVTIKLKRFGNHVYGRWNPMAGF